MKKKLLAILLMSVMAFSVTACGGVLDVAGSLKDGKEENMSNKPQDSVNVDEEEEVVEEDTSLDLDEAITDALLLRIEKLSTAMPCLLSNSAP